MSRMTWGTAPGTALICRVPVRMRAGPGAAAPLHPVALLDIGPYLAGIHGKELFHGFLEDTGAFLAPVLFGRLPVSCGVSRENRGSGKNRESEAERKPALHFGRLSLGKTGSRPFCRTYGRSAERP